MIPEEHIDQIMEVAAKFPRDSARIIVREMLETWYGDKAKALFVKSGTGIRPEDGKRFDVYDIKPGGIDVLREPHKAGERIAPAEIAQTLQAWNDEAKATLAQQMPTIDVSKTNG